MLRGALRLGLLGIMLGAIAAAALGAIGTRAGTAELAFAAASLLTLVLGAGALPIARAARVAPSSALGR